MRVLQLKKLIWLALAFAMWTACSLSDAATNAGVVSDRTKALDDLVPRVSAMHIELPSGALLFFGSKHSLDPNDQQNSDIEILWSRFQPTVAIVEGGNWPLAPDRTTSIRNYGEMGLTTFLASRSKVRKLDADPPIEQELKWVLNTNSPEIVKLYYVLRMVPQWRMESDSDQLDTKLIRFLKNSMFDNQQALSKVLTTQQEFEGALYRLEPRLANWKLINGNFVSIAGPSSKLAAVARSSNQFRDNYMFNRVAELVHKGERVFLIAGNDHLIAQRARLSSELLKR